LIFFGNIKEIIQLDYNLEDMSVVLFKCDWFKLDGKRTALHDDGFLEASMLEVCGTRMIVLYWPIMLGRFSIC
jgi:hypothetical protein